MAGAGSSCYDKISWKSCEFRPLRRFGLSESWLASAEPSVIAPRPFSATAFFPTLGNKGLRVWRGIAPRRTVATAGLSTNPTVASITKNGDAVTPGQDRRSSPPNRPPAGATTIRLTPTTPASRPSQDSIRGRGRLDSGAATSAGMRFHVLRLHAQGGIGKVSVAYDAELQREVALKQIKPERADDADSRARFLQEAEVTGRLEHPGIVPVYALGADDQGRPFYAMRFVRGTSLDEAIRRYHQADSEVRRSSRGSRARASAAARPVRRRLPHRRLRA